MNKKVEKATADKNVKKVDVKKNIPLKKKEKSKKKYFFWHCLCKFHF